MRLDAAAAGSYSGQVSFGNTVMKGNACKVRRMRGDQILAGFAGGTADAFTLFERFEAKLDKHQGNLKRSAVELAKDWRTDRALRRLEALLAVTDRGASLVISGTGDVIEPEGEVLAIGSGGPFAQAAARARQLHRTTASCHVLGIDRAAPGRTSSRRSSLYVARNERPGPA